MTTEKQDDDSSAPVERWVRPEPDFVYALILLSAASKSRDEGALRLAAQLANAEPCGKCGYIWNHCRCVPNA
jgi:hypothetical protein